MSKNIPQCGEVYAQPDTGWPGYSALQAGATYELDWSLTLFPVTCGPLVTQVAANGDRHMVSDVRRFAAPTCVSR